jgi:AcrR family transcriptional regulator
MDKREDILEAALELFAERGFHGTSVALIAEKAQVGAGTIYRYFKSKEVLVNFLYQHWKREMSESILAGLDKGLAPRRLFHEIWSRMVAFSRKHPKELMFLEFHHHAPYLDDESRRLCNLLLGEFRQFFEVCREAQITKEASPEILMTIVIGAFNATEKAFMQGEIEPTSENEALVEELCWEAVRR